MLEADTLIVNLEPNEGGFIRIAVILEQITAHVTLEAVRDTTAKETARAILKRYGSFGVPERVAHDGGPEYENNIFSELAKWLQIEDYTTTAHRPQSHGHVERMNSEVLMQIRCLCHHIRNKKDWDMYLPLIEAIVNNIVRKRTGYTANQMLFGMDYAHHRNMIPEKVLIREVHEDSQERVNARLEEVAKDTPEGTTPEFREVGEYVGTLTALMQEMMNTAMIFNTLHMNTRAQLESREKQAKGETKKEVIFRAKEGDLVLYKPPQRLD